MILNNHSKIHIMKKIFLLVIFISINIFLSAQVKVIRAKQFAQPEKAVSFVPFYLATNGVRLDFDFKIKDNHWIQAAPQFYIRERSDYTRSDWDDDYYDDYYYYNFDIDISLSKNYSQLIGTGLHLYHKIYLNDEFSRLNPYLSYGPTWQLFSLNHNEQILNRTIGRTTQINKVGGDVMVGFMLMLHKYIALDFYAGLGFRHSFYSSDADNMPKFNESYIDYGYSGNLFTTGVRITFLK